jgi:aminoglycoside 3-N-acetyltransferase
VSFAAIGPQANEIVGTHPLAPQFGEESPLARLYELDAVVLLIGADHGRNTSLHLAEHRATWPGKSLERHDGAPLLITGHRQWISFVDEPADEDGFDQLGDAFARIHTEYRGPVGVTEARWCAMRQIVDFGVAWLSENRSNENALP